MFFSLLPRRASLMALSKYNTAESALNKVYSFPISMSKLKRVSASDACANFFLAEDIRWRFNWSYWFLFSISLSKSSSSFMAGNAGCAMEMEKSRSKSIFFIAEYLIAFIKTRAVLMQCGKQNYKRI